MRYRTIGRLLNDSQEATIENPDHENPESPDTSADPVVCLCFHVSQRKIVNYCRREKPAVASLMSECLSAGTGCGWCVPFLKDLHQQVKDGVERPALPIDPQAYAAKRANYRKTGRRSDDA